MYAETATKGNAKLLEKPEYILPNFVISASLTGEGENNEFERLATDRLVKGKFVSTIPNPPDGYLAYFESLHPVEHVLALMWNAGIRPQIGDLHSVAGKTYRVSGVSFWNLLEETGWVIVKVFLEEMPF